MFQWYQNLPTWGKWALPIGVLGLGYVALRGGGEGGDGGEEEGQAVLPLITPSTGPSFPAGAIGGGSDYAPPGGGGGGSGGGAPPVDPTEPPPPGGSGGGGGPGGTDLPPAPPPITPDEYNPPEAPAGPRPLSAAQRRAIKARLEALTKQQHDRVRDVKAKADKKAAEIRGRTDKSAAWRAGRIAQVRMGEAASITAIRADIAAKKAAALVMYGAGYQAYPYAN